MVKDIGRINMNAIEMRVYGLLKELDELVNLQQSFTHTKLDLKSIGDLVKIKDLNIRANARVASIMVQLSLLRPLL